MLVSFFAALMLAWQGISTEIAAREDLEVALKLTHAAMDLKFLAADVNGWQTAYAFDVVRKVPDASEDSSPHRAKFLTSAAAFRARLDSLSSAWLTEGEAGEWKRASAAFDEFMRIDQEIIAAYRIGRAERQHEANELVLGREIENFENISAIITRLAQSIMDRSRRASEQASKASDRSRWLFVGGGLATLPLLIACLALVFRSTPLPMEPVFPRGGSNSNGES
jgi:methyl-accepting chemotaxis protein